MTRDSNRVGNSDQATVPEESVAGITTVLEEMGAMAEEWIPTTTVEETKDEEQQTTDEQPRVADLLASPRSSGRCCSVSTFGAVANLCSATLGAGILALPYGIYQSGLVAGAALMLFAALSTTLSIDLLVEATRKFNSTTYEDLVQQGLGKSMRKITEFSILLFCEGVCVAYLIAAGDILEPIVGRELRSEAMIITWSLTMLPLSLLKTMEALQWASSIGISSIGILVIVGSHHAIVDRSTSASIESVLWPANGIISILVACPVVLFAFSCQVNVCAIYDELPSKSSMKWVTRCAVFICAFLYSSMALVSLYDFGSAVEPNILGNYSNPTWWEKSAFYSMALAVTVAFPLNVFPARVTLMGLWNAKRRAGYDEVLDEPLLQAHSSDSILMDISVSSALSSTASHDRQRTNSCQHYVWSILIATSSLALSLVIPNISVVFGLLGGTISALLGFLLPGALGIKIGHTISGWFLIIMGGIIGVLTTAVTIYTTFW